MTICKLRNQQGSLKRYVVLQQNAENTKTNKEARCLVCVYWNMMSKTFEITDIAEVLEEEIGIDRNICDLIAVYSEAEAMETHGY